MKLFITGADGMLGSNIVREAIKQGHHVRALVQPGRTTGTLDGLDIERCTGDLLDAKGLESLMIGCDAVIHVAASTAVWPGRNPAVGRINVDGTRAMMHSAMAVNVKRFIHIGSANSFAPGTSQRPGTEQNAYDGWRYRNDYMDTKYLSQKLLLDAHRETGFPVVIINPTFMIGPFDSGPSSGRLMLSVIQGKVPGYSKGVKNYIHAADVAVAAVNALTKGRPGECYIAGNENLNFEAFFRLVCSVTNTPFRMRKIPYFLVLIGGFFGSVWGRLSGNAPKLSYGMARMSGIEQYYSAKKAVSELSMPQTPIDQAIRDSVHWFKEHRYL